MNSQDMFDRFDGKTELKIGWLNRIADAVTKLLRIQVAPPLELRDLGAGGILISLADEKVEMWARLTAGGAEFKQPYSWTALTGEGGKEVTPPFKGEANANAQYLQWGIWTGEAGVGTEVLLYRPSSPKKDAEWEFGWFSGFFAKITAGATPPLYNFTTEGVITSPGVNITATAKEIHDVTNVTVGVVVWVEKKGKDKDYTFEYVESPEFWAKVKSGTGPYVVTDANSVDYDAVEKNDVRNIAVNTWVRVEPEVVDEEIVYSFEHEHIASSDDTIDVAKNPGGTWDLKELITSDDASVTCVKIDGGWDLSVDIPDALVDGAGIIFSGDNDEIINVDLADAEVRGLRLIGDGNDRQLAVLLTPNWGLNVDVSGVYVEVNNAAAVYVDEDGLGVIVDETMGLHLDEEAGIQAKVDEAKGLQIDPDTGVQVKLRHQSTLYSGVINTHADGLYIPLSAGTTHGDTGLKFAGIYATDNTVPTGTPRLAVHLSTLGPLFFDTRIPDPIAGLRISVEGGDEEYVKPDPTDGWIVLDVVPEERRAIEGLVMLAHGDPQTTLLDTSLLIP